MENGVLFMCWIFSMIKINKYQDRKYGDKMCWVGKTPLRVATMEILAKESPVLLNKSRE